MAKEKISVIDESGGKELAARIKALEEKMASFAMPDLSGMFQGRPLVEEETDIQDLPDGFYYTTPYIKGLPDGVFFGFLILFSNPELPIRWVLIFNYTTGIHYSQFTKTTAPTSWYYLPWLNDANEGSVNALSKTGWVEICPAGYMMDVHNPATVATLEALETGKIPFGLSDEVLEKVRENLGDIFDELDQTATLEMNQAKMNDEQKIQAAIMAYKLRKAQRADNLLPTDRIKVGEVVDEAATGEVEPLKTEER